MKKRLRDIGEARIVIENVGKEPEVAIIPAPRHKPWLAWGIAALAALAFLHFRETPPAREPGTARE